MTTTYTVRALNSDTVWTFKYDLNGDLRAFKIEEGKLSGRQIKWLFASGNFPANESIMKTEWMQKMKNNFEIIIGKPDLSFDNFWKLYNHKVKKTVSQRVWKRLSKKDKLEAVKHIKEYDKYLMRKHIAKANPSTYLNQRYWEDNHGSIH